ncbi:hypothetical protein [Treponema vincentii]|nr:hypothetical protein [Treponema vincentii]
MKSIFFIDYPSPSGAKLLILNYFLGAPIRCFTVADGLYKERISE